VSARAKLPWLPISAAAGVLVLFCMVIWRANLGQLSFAEAVILAACSLTGLVLTERKRVRQWWRRVRPWGWETVRDTGITQYQVHPSGKRRAVQQHGGGYQPIDRGWVDTGEWTAFDRAAFTAAVQCVMNARKEPQPDTIVVDPETAKLCDRLQAAHAAGDTKAMDAVRDEAFNRLRL